MSCPDCTSRNLLPGSPKGTEEGSAYLAKGSNRGDTADKAVVVFTDSFGLAISNPKIIADTIAERTGFDVWVPDLFNGVLSTCIRDLDARRSPYTTRPGHPPVPSNTPDFAPRSPGEKVGFWRMAKFYLTALTNVPGFIAARPGVVDPRAKEVSPFALRAVELEFDFSSVLDQDQDRAQLQEHWCCGVSIYLHFSAPLTLRDRYCFGGALSTRIVQFDAITSVVIAHPACPALKDIKAINVRAAFFDRSTKASNITSPETCLMDLCRR